MKRSAPLLVELGTEELPTECLDVVYSNLARIAEEKLKARRLAFRQLKVEATPRRIVLFIDSLAAKQEDQNLEIYGPSYAKAYDGQGVPTPALEGFLKNRQAKIEDLVIEETPKGKYVLIRKKERGKALAAILPSLLGEIFTSLSFPKLMRWEPADIRFPRPIRWILVLLDRKVTAFRWAGVTASSRTYGHRFLAPKAVVVGRADWKHYQVLLRRAHVILDREIRKELIRKGLRKFHQKGFDEELVHTTAQLVEEPFLVQGKFSKTYLDLPEEVLASCMKKNQKIFACVDRNGRLVGQFIAVLNGKRRGLQKIKQDYENVLESRLRDARYFYEEDTKEPLEKKLPLLEPLAYLGKLGTMSQKTARLERLAEIFAALIGRKDMKEDLKRTARLSKIDLVTKLVYEFPDLQGIAGREYALASGEKEEVAKALGTQYHPKNLGEDHKNLPKQMGPLGALFGLIDRLDLLVGAFHEGLEPTGSQDPFALRRAGGILVKIIRAFKFHFSMREALEAAGAQYPNFSMTEEEKSRLLKFLQERMIFELQLRPGTRAYEIFEAVSRSSFDDLADAYDRYETLMKLSERDADHFLKAAKVVERTANILKGTQGTDIQDVDPSLFKEPLERDLFQLVQDRSPEISSCLERRDYEKATLVFGNVFYAPLHDFFDRVLVNVEDSAIRSNRQALMKRINRLYTERLADLSVLSRLGQE